LNSGKTIDVVNAAVLANKLLQICNGSIYDGDQGEYHILHDEKIKELKNIVDDNSNENLLIAYNFKSDLDRLKKAFPYAKEIDPKGKAVKDWNDGKIKMLLAHPASAGHGLNLQFGGHILVWFGLNWSLELYQQFIARLDRQGQKKAVRILHLIAKGGIDEKLMEAIDLKYTTQKKLLDYLKGAI
jgi:SNF2 family DNA or RNA helicase